MVKKVVGMKPFGKFSRGAVQIFVLGELGAGVSRMVDACRAQSVKHRDSTCFAEKGIELQAEMLAAQFFYKFS
jgi:hypothetical protein